MQARIQRHVPRKQPFRRQQHPTLAGRRLRTIDPGFSGRDSGALPRRHAARRRGDPQPFAPQRGGLLLIRRVGRSGRFGRGVRQNRHRTGQYGHAVLLRRRRDSSFARGGGRRGRRSAGRGPLSDTLRNRKQDRRLHRRTDPRRRDASDRRGRHPQRRTGGSHGAQAPRPAHRSDDRRGPAALGKRRNRQFAEKGHARHDRRIAGPRLAPSVRLYGLPQRPRDERRGVDQRSVPHPRKSPRHGDQFGRRGGSHGTGVRRLGRRTHYLRRGRSARLHVRRCALGGRQNLHRHPLDHPEGRIEDQSAADARRGRRHDPPHGPARGHRIRRSAPERPQPRRARPCADLRRPPLGARRAGKAACERFGYTFLRIK